MNKRKKTYWLMVIASIVTIILFCISSFIMEKFNTWIPMLISGLLFIFVFIITIIMYIKYVVFICPKCNQRFKAKSSTIIWAIHTPTKRYLKCPHCNTKSWCKEDFE